MNEAQTFVLEDFGIRGALVRVRETWLQTIAQHIYPQTVQAALGQTLAATVLLATALKDRPGLSLQLQSDGPLKLLLVQCSGELAVRATAQWREHQRDALLLGNGRLTVNVDTGRENGFFQGIVPLEAATIHGCLEAYFIQSEQLPTRFLLHSDAECVAGLLVQTLPGAEAGAAFERIAEQAAAIPTKALVTRSAAELLPGAFPGTEIRLFSPRPVQHDCRCTPEHLAGIARLLGQEELESILAEMGSVELTCEFCNRSFAYDEADITAILGGAAPAPELH